VSTRQGVIDAESIDMSNEEIQSELVDQSLSKAYRLIRHEDGKLFP
jgi:hypothetical protein